MYALLQVEGTAFVWQTDTLRADEKTEWGNHKMPVKPSAWEWHVWYPPIPTWPRQAYCQKNCKYNSHAWRNLPEIKRQGQQTLLTNNTIWTPVLPSTNCANVGKLLNLSELQFLKSNVHCLKAMLNNIQSSWGAHGELDILASFQLKWPMWPLPSNEISRCSVTSKIRH